MHVYARSVFLLAAFIHTHARSTVGAGAGAGGEEAEGTGGTTTGSRGER